MSDLIVLKLGGSILTYKEKNQSIFRTRIVDRIIKEIKKFLSEKPSNLIIVLGTGSFGHPVANKYQLNKGLINSDSIWGFSQSKRQNFLVNHYFWQLMEKNKLASVPIQPSAVTVANKGKITKMDTVILCKMLQKGLIILTFGDEVLDSKLGFSIGSSDQIAAFLAKKLKAKKLLFASDVDGVYDSNPKLNKNAKRKELLTSENYSTIVKSLKVYNKLDVSNEMAGKLRALKDFKTNQGSDIKIFSGLKVGNIYKALSGEKIGTLIKL